MTSVLYLNYLSTRTFLGQLWSCANPLQRHLGFLMSDTLRQFPKKNLFRGVVATPLRRGSRRNAVILNVNKVGTVQGSFYRGREAIHNSQINRGIEYSKSGLCKHRESIHDSINKNKFVVLSRRVYETRSNHSLLKNRFKQSLFRLIGLYFVKNWFLWCDYFLYINLALNCF